ncbi:MAG: AAA family ATPase, partial [Deltaproteobacteria bacterium]
MTPSTYTTYFGLQDKPFTVTTDPHFFYPTSTSQKVYASLLHGIRERKGVIVLTGAAGTGKTTLLRRVMRDAGETVHCVFFSNPDWTFDELLSFTCEELGLQVEEETRLQKFQALIAFVLARVKEGETPVLLIDEAQDLGDEVLENLGLLSAPETAGAMLLPIVLAGQPELERKLAQPHLRHLTQRVALRCRLARLKDQEVGPFISHRLQRAGCERQDLFPPEALQCIARYSRGIPRLITTICHEALFIAYRTARKTVSVEIIEQVVRNLQLDQTRIQRLWRRAFAGKRPQKRRATTVRAEGEPLFRQEKDTAARAHAEQTASPVAVPQPTVVRETPAQLARAPSTPRRPVLLLLSSSWIYLLSSAALLAGGGYWLSTFSGSVSPQKPTPGLEALALPPSPPQEKKGTEAGLPLLGESLPRKRQRIPLPHVRGKRRLREGLPFLLRRLWPRPPRCSRSRCRSSLVLRRRRLRQETCSRWPKDSVCALLSRPRVETAAPCVIPGSSMVESKRRENSGPTGRILQ